MTSWQQAIYDQIDFGSFYKDKRDGKVVCFRPTANGEASVTSGGCLMLFSIQVVDDELNMFLTTTYVFKKPFDFNNEFTLEKKDGYWEDLAR